MEGVGDDADIARMEAHLGSHLLAALEHGLVHVERGLGLALQLAKFDERRRIARLGDLLDIQSLQYIGLFLLSRLIGAAGIDHHQFEFKPDLPFDR